MVQKTCFIQKLHTILESDQYNHLIRWSPSGTSFLVLDSAELSSQVLPTVFKHNNYTSFVRQLNLYGFHKKNRSYHRNVAGDRETDINGQPLQHEPREFSHHKFLRYRPDLLAEIRRKPTTAQQQQMMQQPKESSLGSRSDSEAYEPRPMNQPPALQIPSGRSPVSPMPPYASSSYSRNNDYRNDMNQDDRRAPSSRSSYSSSPTAAQPSSPQQFHLMQEMQTTMMKQIAYLQETVHHLTQQVRETRERNDILEREVDTLTGGRKRKRMDIDDERRPVSERRGPMDDRRGPVDDRRPMSPLLPFSRHASRSSPPLLPASGSSITLPPPSALASFNPTPYASPPVDGERGYRSSSKDESHRGMRGSGMVLAPLVRDGESTSSKDWDPRSRGSNSFRLNL